jgi:LmbE family N-acetylglucosaminyl deacetylase
MAVLGVEEHQVLGLPDGGLDDHDAAGLAWVTALMDDVAPDTVLTFGPGGGTYHNDHLAVHRWVTTVWEQRGVTGRLLYATSTADHLRQHRRLYEEWGIYMADLRPVGVRAEDLALHVRLEGPALDRKVAALRSMATQTAEALAQLDLPAFAALVAEEAFIDARSVAVGNDRPRLRRRQDGIPAVRRSTMRSPAREIAEEGPQTALLR